jgi:DNA-binding transcriptional LysR family regulator
MNLDSLEVLIAVARRGAFAAVARDMGVAPSSVSRTIAGLEQELGLRLFQRTTRSLSLTEAGRAYLARVEPLVEELERARHEAVDLGTRPQGTLRIAAPVSFSQLNLVPLVPEFARRYPELSFDLVLTDASLDLLTERLDVAIHLGTPPESGLIATRLTPMVARVCASPSYLLERGQPRRPQELAEHECLLLDMPGFSDAWRFRGRGANAQEAFEVQVGGRLRTSNAVALKELALQGMGVTLQGRWIVGRELHEGTLVDLFPDYDATAASLGAPAAWLLYPSRSYLPLKVRVFIDFLREAFRKSPPWDSPVPRQGA